MMRSRTLTPALLVVACLVGVTLIRMRLTGAQQDATASNPTNEHTSAEQRPREARAATSSRGRPGATSPLEAPATASAGRVAISVPYQTRVETIMATPIAVTAPGDQIGRAAPIVFRIFRDIDARMSEWKPTSPLSAVNKAAGRHPVPVPDDLRALIRRAIDIGRRTDGAFDITWAALWGLWDFKADPPRVPSPDEIAARVKLIDYRRVQIDDAAGTVYLPQPGMLIGLGGIAKGYALDRAAAALRDAGIDSFLLSAGGQVYAGGRKGDRAWRVGIRDPRGPRDDYFAFVEIEDASLSTSGDYERYFVVDGVRYHHILDPRTGRPARGLRSVTIVSPDATLADALSTAVMVLGPERGLAVVGGWEGVEAVLVDDSGQQRTTPGLAQRLHTRHAPEQP